MTGEAAPSFDQVTAGVSNGMLEALKKLLDATWGSLTSDERAACVHLLETIVRARFYELLGRDVSAQLRTLNVAFEQWEALGKAVMVDGIRNVATEAFGFAGAFAGSAVAAVLKKGIGA